MKTLGIGIDIINNKRIRALINNKSFIDRTYGKSEIKLSKKIANKTNYFAKRFAAKEAFVKSIGEGFRNNINFNDINIVNDKKGKPKIHISNNIKKVIKKKFKMNKYKIYLSLSDEKMHSIAFVIINKKK